MIQLQHRVKNAEARVLAVFGTRSSDQVVSPLMSDRVPALRKKRRAAAAADPVARTLAGLVTNKRKPKLDAADFVYVADVQR
jgi:hypothetical protein